MTNQEIGKGVDDVLDQIIRYETGEMDGDEIKAFFQKIIDSGLVWQLQGSYGRTANTLIAAGYCTPKA